MTSPSRSLLLALLAAILSKVSAATVQKLSEEDCSICADGSAPSNPTATFAVSSSVTLSCQLDLPTNAIASIYQQGLTNTDYQCAISQLWAYEYCGCPTPPELARECSICANGDTNYTQGIWVPTSSAPEGTCRFQAIYGGLRYDHFGRASDAPELKCPFMTWGMDTWCGCPAETASLPDCTLCGGNDKTKTSSDKTKCRRNPLAPWLHTSSSTTQSPLGVNFGTCQYYDWLVERLNPVQCGIFEVDATMTQFDGFHVKSFCCGPEATTAVSAVALCSDPATLVADQWIPELDATCQEIQQVAPYLRNETLLVQPQPMGGSSTSLRDYCCTGQPATETQPQQPQREPCQEIPRIEYERSGAVQKQPNVWISLLLVLLLVGQSSIPSLQQIGI